MSAEKVLNALLKADAALVALVGADNIFPGVIPQGTELPAVAYNHISTVERTTLAMNESKVVTTSRIEVAVQAKTYPSQKAVLAAVRAACKNRQGTIAGVYVHSVLRDTVGPDMRDDDAGIYMQTIDFKVTFDETNP
jgi:hypothetical protein